MNCQYGIKFKTDGFTGGSLVVLDSYFSGVQFAISIDQPKDAVSVTLQHVRYTSTSIMVLDSKASAILVGGSSGTIDSWIVGANYQHPDFTLNKLKGSATNQGKPTQVDGLMDSNGNYFSRSKPQYQDKAASEMINALDWSQHGIYFQTTLRGRLLTSNRDYSGRW